MTVATYCIYTNQIIESKKIKIKTTLRQPEGHQRNLTQDVVDFFQNPQQFSLLKNQTFYQFREDNGQPIGNP